MCDNCRRIERELSQAPNTLPSSEYLAHVKKLAASHGINIYYVKRQLDFSASPSDGYIRITEHLNDAGYAAALHELGHLISDEASRMALKHSQDVVFANMGLADMLPHSNRKAIYKVECLAWEWAKQHAMLWGPSMQYSMDSGLASYEHLNA
jgi:hypothetical protein